MPRKLLCVVATCNARPGNHEVFPFPKCTQTSKLWKEALGIVEKDSTNVHNRRGVCELHFDEAFLVKEEFNRNVRLMIGAVPSISLGAPCRMCAKEEEKVMHNTIKELVKDKHLLPVLDMCLDLRSASHSKLPTGVCEACTLKIHYFCEFAKSCWFAQDTLLARYTKDRGVRVEPWRRIWRYPEEPEPQFETLVETPDMTTEIIEKPDCSNSSTLVEPMEFHLSDAVTNIREESVDLDVPKGILKFEESASVERIPDHIGTPFETCDIKTKVVENFYTESVPFVSSLPENVSIKPEIDIEEEHIMFHNIGVATNVNEESIDPETLNEAVEEDLDESPAANIGEPPTKKFKSTEKPFECIVCAKKFKTQRTMQRHIRKELAKKGLMLRCLECNECYDTAEELRKHCITKHKT